VVACWQEEGERGRKRRRGEKRGEEGRRGEKGEEEVEMGQEGTGMETQRLDGPSI